MWGQDAKVSALIITFAPLNQPIIEYEKQITFANILRHAFWGLP